MSAFSGEKSEELTEEEKKAIAEAQEDDGLPDEEEDFDDSGN